MHLTSPAICFEIRVITASFVYKSSGFESLSARCLLWSGLVVKWKTPSQRANFVKKTRRFGLTTGNLYCFSRNTVINSWHTPNLVSLTCTSEVGLKFQTRYRLWIQYKASCVLY